jgi:ribonuclease E
MPLTVACASPEMASGKVWIRYPVVRPQDQQQEDVQVQEFSTTAAEPVVAPVAAAEPVVSEVIAPAVAAESAVEPVATTEPVAVINEPEVPVVETTHPEAIAAPVDEQPQLIAEADEAVAEEVVAEAVDVVAQEAVEPEAAVAEPVAVEETAVVVEEAPVVSEPVVEPAPAAEPVVATQPVVTAAPVVKVANRHATAPMTRAPAPDYVPEAPRQSEWVRPNFDFDGKGSAGGHSATHKAAAGPTRPQPVE